MRNRQKIIMKKTDKNYLIFVVVVLVLLGIAGCWPVKSSKQKEGLCIEPDNRHKDKLQLVYLPQQDCQGFKFKQMEGLVYKRFASFPKRDSAEIFINSELPYWFSGRSIIFEVNANAIGERYKHTSNFRSYKESGSVYFDGNWQMEFNRRNYHETPSDKSHYRGFYYFDEEHVFHAFCIFPQQEVNNDSRCTLYLTLHDTILVRLGAHYGEMSDAAEKMKELKGFLESILIQREG